MELNEYQKRTVTTAVYPGKGEQDGFEYVLFGLAGEAGEVCNKYKKVLRDNKGVISSERRALLLDELGDVLWYLAAAINELDESLENVAKNNLAKLSNRFANGTLHRSGDSR